MISLIKKKKRYFEETKELWIQFGDEFGKSWKSPKIKTFLKIMKKKWKKKILIDGGSE